MKKPNTDLLQKFNPEPQPPLYDDEEVAPHLIGVPNMEFVKSNTDEQDQKEAYESYKEIVENLMQRYEVSDLNSDDKIKSVLEKEYNTQGADLFDAMQELGDVHVFQQMVIEFDETDDIEIDNYIADEDKKKVLDEFSKILDALEAQGQDLNVFNELTDEDYDTLYEIVLTAYENNNDDADDFLDELDDSDVSIDDLSALANDRIVNNKKPVKKKPEETTAFFIIGGVVVAKTKAIDIVKNFTKDDSVKNAMKTLRKARTKILKKKKKEKLKQKDSKSPSVTKQNTRTTKTKRGKKHWFERMSKPRQDKYCKMHPRSRYCKKTTGSFEKLKIGQSIVVKKL